jgi:hypothetical protein
MSADSFSHSLDPEETSTALPLLVGRKMFSTTQETRIENLPLLADLRRTLRRL